MAIRVGVFFGGKSVEHEVSVISALQALAALDQSKYEPVPVYIAKDGRMFTGPELTKIEEFRDIPALLKKSVRVLLHEDDGRYLLLRYPLKKFGDPSVAAIDVAFPIVHGANVEDGTLQGYLKFLSIPFVGCDVTASAAGMDKYVMKAVLRENGLPVLDCRRIYVKDYFADSDQVIASVESEIPYPVIVKPVNLGSSIGIKKASDSAGLRDALDYAFQYSNLCLVEPAIQNLKEINCAVLGDRESIQVSECEEPVGSDEILSYEDKYVSGGKDGGSKGMSGQKRKLPADISEETRDAIRSMAGRTFQALDCNGVARIDFMIDQDSGKIWVNEINTIPGSLSFYLWKPVGLSYPQLLDEMISLALKRQREEEDITYSFETGILSQFSGGFKSGGKL